MKTIKLNDKQVKFVYNALEHRREAIWDDPSAFGFEEEDFEENEDKVMAEIYAFQQEMVYDVLEQLK